VNIAGIVMRWWNEHLASRRICEVGAYEAATYYTEGWPLANIPFPWSQPSLMLLSIPL